MWRDSPRGNRCFRVELDRHRRQIRSFSINISELTCLRCLPKCTSRCNVSIKTEATFMDPFDWESYRISVKSWNHVHFVRAGLKTLTAILKSLAILKQWWVFYNHAEVIVLKSTAGCFKTLRMILKPGRFKITFAVSKSGVFWNSGRCFKTEGRNLRCSEHPGVHPRNDRPSLVTTVIRDHIKPRA